MRFNTFMTSMCVFLFFFWLFIQFRVYALLTKRLCFQAQNYVINHISPPRTFTTGWCSTKRAKLIIQFLENFAEISRRSNYTVSANFNIASNGPRFLQCEKCSRLFSGLHDRFLKIFVHYKTCHKEKCNLLIGLKWVKHQNTVQSMIGAWQRDQLILKHKFL